ncbi:MAG: EamA family transporter [Microbacteriaceae bacterium]|nr:EamA family transporter [Microbacteriaceae bacterium]
MKISGPALALTAMITVQLGVALSTNLFAAVTPAGSVWLRVTVAAVVLLAVTRPSLRAIPRGTLLSLLALGVLTAVMMLTFIESVARIPLGTAGAIQFAGPLMLAAVKGRRLTALIWPLLALVGVLGLTQPWAGALNVIGIGFALASAAGWAGYIVLTQHVGNRLTGLQGLALSLAISSVVIAPFGASAAIAGVTPLVALEAVGLAVLIPLLPFSLELVALRRMTVPAFGTLMAVEPAVATVIGLVVLAQSPNPLQLLGVALVVVAGIGAQRVRADIREAASGNDRSRMPATESSQLPAPS